MTLLCLALFGEALGRGDPRWAELLAWLDEGGPCSLTSRIPSRESAPNYPPCQEVTDLWERAGPADSLGPVADWCVARHLDRSRVRERDLVRVLPPSHLPRWAQGPVGTWRDSGHLAILPLYDASASLRSVKVRLVTPCADPRVMKSYPPRGHRVGGLVMADPLFREVLARGASGPAASVVVVEGEPDFLTWATAWHANEPGRHAVCGIFNGSWSSAIAARLPAGSRVVVRTHADPQGEAYARDILLSLDPTVLSVVRAPAGSTDVRR